MTIEELRKGNGAFDYSGKTYVLVQKAYINGSFDSPYYCATAICPSEGVDEDGLYSVYDITWYPKQDWLDSDRDDEGLACDWDSPYSVEQTPSVYDLSDGSFRFCIRRYLL